MKNLLRKPALILCASVLVVAGAAVSFASFKERSATEAEEVIATAPAETEPTESIEPVGDENQTQSAVKPVNRTMTYEQQAEMIEEQTRRRNEAVQQIETH